MTKNITKLNENLERGNLVTLKLKEQEEYIYGQVLCACENKIIINNSYGTDIFFVQEKDGILLLYVEDLEGNSSTTLGKCDIYPRK